jgi:hypothetical protein
MLLAGITALVAATMDERMEVMRYLLDHGADPNKQYSAGFAALHCAATKGLFSALPKLSVCGLAFAKWLQITCQALTEIMFSLVQIISNLVFLLFLIPFLWHIR